MNHKENLLTATAKGGIAGLLGTVVLSLAVKTAPTLLRQVGIDAPEPPAGAKENEPTEKLAQKLATGVLDTHLDKEQKEAAGQALHWGYGAGWGALYGIIQSTFRLPFIITGTLLGAAMIVAASTLVPAMGVAPPADKVPAEQKVMQAAFIMLYSWTTALVYHLVSRD